MHPELLNNSLFLKYYRKWQEDPSSILFAPIAEFFLQFGMINEALKICEQGLKNHPNLVSGHMVMAKVSKLLGDYKRAKNSLSFVFSVVPNNSTARELMNEIERKLSGQPEANFESQALPVSEQTEEITDRIPSWETVTMANIYTAQGHFSRAREIYQSILKREPSNEAAKKGLDYLSRVEG